MSRHALQALLSAYHLAVRRCSCFCVIWQTSAPLVRNICMHCGQVTGVCKTASCGLCCKPVLAAASEMSTLYTAARDWAGCLANMTYHALIGLSARSLNMSKPARKAMSSSTVASQDLAAPRGSHTSATQCMPIVQSIRR